MKNIQYWHIQLLGNGWISPVSKKMVLSHHERKDGSGYPLKQKTKDAGMPIYCRHDAFDCFIGRMECKRISVQQALETSGGRYGYFYDRKIIACDRENRRTLSSQDEGSAEYRRNRNRFKTDGNSSVL